MPAQIFAFDLIGAGEGSVEGIPLVLETIALNYFGEPTNLVTFSNVKLPDYVTIDFVLARHKPFTREIDDFVPVELRAFLPTKESMTGGNTSKPASPHSADYERKLRAFLCQLLDRGIVYEAWGVKSYWVIPEPIYASMVKRFGFKPDGFSAEHAVRFALQDVTAETNRVPIRITRYVSVSANEIYRALRNDSGFPDRAEFMAALSKRLRRMMLSGLRKSLN
ncbi:MAG: hypothetical protein FJZ96_00140 [Chloroflexi bacterium]|nr:hypothetical protein [Chloroflexota bacterium]